VDPFELSLPSKVVFRAGCVETLGAETAPFSRHVLLVSDGAPERIEKALASLKASGVAVAFYVVKGEPTLDAVRGGVRTAQKAGCTGVVAVGGGSVMDASKAVAAMSANSGDLMDYLEVIGAGKALVKPPLFLAAVPTTAGTGAEATRNAVLTSPEHRVKVSLRHPQMVPRLILLDPALTLSLPPDVTASTGMDALCQLLEAFTCRTPNPFTDGLCREGLALAARSLKWAFTDGSDVKTRSDMMLAAHFSGMALANAKLGAVHGFAAPLGGMYPAAHGEICAALLPAVTRANLKALAARATGHAALARYAEAAKIRTGRADARAEDAADACEELRNVLGIPRLGPMGVKRDDFETLAAKAAKASSMKGNPVELTEVELIGILDAAF
jgi:alcohol dehydrogenase class IV